MNRHNDPRNEKWLKAYDSREFETFEGDFKDDPDSLFSQQLNKKKTVEERINEEVNSKLVYKLPRAISELQLGILDRNKSTLNKQEKFDFCV